MTRFYKTYMDSPEGREFAERDRRREATIKFVEKNERPLGDHGTPLVDVLDWYAGYLGRMARRRTE